MGRVKGGAGHSREFLEKPPRPPMGRRPGQSVPRLQARQGRAKVRRPGHPCTRGRVRPGERGSGPGVMPGGTPLSGRVSPPPVAPAPRRRPARPPGARPRPVAAERVTDLPSAHLGRSERLRRCCTRGSGSGPGSGVPRGDRLTVDEKDQRSVCPAPRWPPRRPAATSPTRPDTPLGRPPPGRPTPTQNWPGCTAAHVVLSPPPLQRDNDQSFPRS